jgi:hypothetical protein
LGGVAGSAGVETGVTVVAAGVEFTFVAFLVEKWVDPRGGERSKAFPAL